MITNRDPASIKIIRYALLSGVLLFGAIAALIASDLPGGITANAQGPLAGPVALLVILAAGAVMYARRRLELISDLDERFKWLLVVHALCEGAALLGAVHLLTSGAIIPYIAGATVFGFSFVLLPIEQERL